MTSSAATAATMHVEDRSARRQSLQHLAIIALSGAVLRVFYHVAFKPGIAGDTNAYTSMYFLWSRHYFSNSYRPPIYSLFLWLVSALAGPSPAWCYSAVYLQSVLGVAAALGIYAMLRTLDVRPRIALIGGLAFSLLGVICQVELLLLSELLSLVTLTFGALFFVRAARAIRNGKSVGRFAAVSGVFLSLAVLTRPENSLFAATLVLMMFVVGFRLRSAPLLRMATVVALTTAPLILLWMTWTYLNIGQFRLTILTGVARTESVYNLFDRVGSEDQVAGALLQKSYLYSNRDGHTYRHHVWYAIPELMAAARSGQLPVSLAEPLPRSAIGLAARHWVASQLRLQERVVVNGQVISQPVALYDYLGELSGRLARQNPAAYVRNVVSNFFTDPFRYTYPPPTPPETEDPHAPEGGSTVRFAALYTVAKWWTWIESPILLAGYLAMLGYVAYLIVGVIRGTEAVLRRPEVGILATANFAVVAGSCVFAAYYPEHGIPFFGLFIVYLCTFGSSF
jgi:hypothetical protein